MCATSLRWRHLVNAYGVKAGWFIPFVDKRVVAVIPPTRAVPERIRGGYKSMFTLLTLRHAATPKEGPLVWVTRVSALCFLRCMLGESEGRKPTGNWQTEVHLESDC